MIPIVYTKVQKPPPAIRKQSNYDMEMAMINSQ